MISFDEFQAVDIRVGRIVSRRGLPRGAQAGLEAVLDFGPELGEKRSSAQITNYSREELEGSLVVAVVNFPPRQIGPVRSEVLVLGVPDEDGNVILLRPTRKCRWAPGCSEPAPLSRSGAIGRGRPQELPARAGGGAPACGRRGTSAPDRAGPC